MVNNAEEGKWFHGGPAVAEPAFPGKGWFPLKGSNLDSRLQRALSYH
jgi:hypothetical protein